MLLERALDTAMRGGARVATYYGPGGKVEVTIAGPISEGAAAAFTRTSALTHLSISPPPDDAVSQLLLGSFVLRNRGDPATHYYVRR